MRVDYINGEIVGDRVRATFVGFDPRTKKRRRPMIELDGNDLSQLIALAVQLRNHFNARAIANTDRAKQIDNSLKEIA